MTNKVHLFFYIAVLSTGLLGNPIIGQYNGIQFYLQAVLVTLLLFPVFLTSNFQKFLFKSEYFHGLIISFILFLTYYSFNVLLFGIQVNTLANCARICFLFLNCLFFTSLQISPYYLIRYLFIILTLVCFKQLTSYNISEFGLNNRISPIGYGGANSFGAIISVTILLRLVYRFLFSKTVNLLDMSVCAPLLLATLVLTFSRGAILGLIIGLFFLYRRWIFESGFRIFGFFFAIVIFFKWYLSTSNFIVVERFRFDKLIDGSGRNIIFRNTIDAFLNNPFFGGGIGKQFNPFLSGSASSHNVFLQILGEGGILGLSIIVFIMFRLFNGKDYSLASPILICMIVFSNTDNHFLAVQFQFVIGIFLGVMARSRLYSK